MEKLNIHRLHDIRNQEINMIEDFLINSKGKNLLELGCGDGYQSQLLHKHFKSIISTDLNETRMNFDLKNLGINLEILDAECVGERFNKESFDLTGGVVTYEGKDLNAKDLEETGQLTFSHWGDLDNPNKNHRNKAVYIFNTGDLWTGNEGTFKSDIHVVGEPITAYWVKAN